MEVTEAVKAVRLLSGEIWNRDKNLFAAKVATLLPDIMQTLIDTHRENQELYNENHRLQSMLDVSNNKIAVLTRESEEGKRMSYFAGQRAAALLRIAEVLESLK